MFHHSKDTYAWILIIWTVIWVAIYIYRFCMQEHLSSNQQNLTPSRMMLKDLNQLPSNRRYGVYGNTVYDLTEVSEDHPGTNSIFEHLNRYEHLDKYLFGLYGPEFDLDTPAYNHTVQSIDMLGEPVGSLVIDNVYSGFNDLGPNVVRVIQIQNIS